MKNKFLKGLTIFGLTVVLFTSCSKAPQAEIDAVKLAIEEANIAGAEIYVHDAFVALQDSLKSLMGCIEGQESKLIKNYSKAKEDLPLPLKPVMTTNFSRGIRTSIFFKL